MAIIAKAGGGGNFKPAPTGVHTGVCVDVVDLGMKPTPWGDKHKIRIVWQIEELMDNGKPFLVSKPYTLSLNEKANLRKDLESWRGRAFTEDESDGFDVEAVIGKNCLLNVQQKVSGENTYANVIGVMPLKKGMPTIQPTDYKRVKDRDPKAPVSSDDEPPMPDYDHTAPAVDEDLVPF